MSNSILTSNIAVPFVAETESNLAILANGRVDFNKEYKPGTGSSIDVLIPGYGSTGTGADLTGRISDVKNNKVSVALTQYSDGVALESLEQSLKLSNYEDQVATPYGAKFASDVQKVAVETLWKGAATAISIAPVSGAASMTYGDISKGIASINSARGFGEKFGAMDPDTATLVQNSGLNFFQADLKQSFVSGKLGTFRGARFFETPDMNFTTLTLGAQAIAATAVFTYTEGASTASIGTGTNTGTLKAGQVLYAAGVNATDIHGNDTGKPLAIVVKSDVAFDTNAATISVEPIYWTAGHPLRNATATINGKVVTSLHAQNKSYKSVLIWDKQSFVTASAMLKGLRMTEKMSGQGKVMNTLFQVGSDPVKGIDVFRWDVLLGFKLLYRQWVSRVDIELV